MSSNAYWRPITPKKGNDLCTEIKWILQKKFELPAQFDNSSLGFFKGLEAAGVKDAQRIIDPIKKHGEIEIWLEF